MFDALVDRQNGQVAGAREPTGVVQAGEVVDDALIAVAGAEDPIDVIRPRQVQTLPGDPLAFVLEHLLRQV